MKKPSIEDEEDDEEDEDEDEDDESEDEESEQQQHPGVKVHLTPLELEGIWNLLGKLEALPTSKKCVPAGIHNAPALITHIKVVCACACICAHACGFLSISLMAASCVLQALLKEHAGDIPKLSYTGRPIVKWPKRVRARLISDPWRKAGPAFEAKGWMAQEMYLIGSSLHLQPSWYRPPPLAPPPRPKLATTPIIPRPQKPASSMSVLRRRRVR